LAKQDAKFQELRSQGRALLMEAEERENLHQRLVVLLQERTAQLVQMKVRVFVCGPVPQYSLIAACLEST
jgi:hypothetical protein